MQEAEEEAGPAQAAVLHETVTFQNEVTEVHGLHLFTAGAEIEEGEREQVSNTVGQVVMTEVEPGWGIDSDDDEASYPLQRESDLTVTDDEVQELNCPDRRRRALRGTCRGSPAVSWPTGCPRRRGRQPQDTGPPVD